MGIEQLKERLHLRIEQADERLLKVVAATVEAMFEQYQTEQEEQISDKDLSLLRGELNEFRGLASLTELLFRETFNDDTSPILLSSRTTKVPKKGAINYRHYRVDYQFHGNGCKFRFQDGTILDFNYDPKLNWSFRGIDFFKFMDFLDSRKKVNLSRRGLEKGLDKLEEEGVINRVDPNFRLYNLNSSPAQ